MRNCALALLSLLLGAALSGGCFGGGGDGAVMESSSVVVARVERGPVSVTASHSPVAPSLVDLVVLAVEVTYPEGVTVQPLAFSQAFEGRFLVRNFVELDAELDGDDRWRRRCEYTLEPEWSGESQIDGWQVRFTDARSEAGASQGEHELSLEPFSIRIAEVDVGQAPSPADLRPPAPPTLLPSEPWSFGWIVIVAVAVVALALGGFWILRRSRPPPPPPPPIPPRLLARAELDRLLRGDLLQLGLLQLFYYELTGIVRRFVEGEYGLHAPEQTTEEFLGDLGRTCVLDGVLTDGLQAFLEAADLVKYAAQIPGEEVARSSVDRAREIIDHEPASRARAEALEMAR